MYKSQSIKDETSTSGNTSRSEADQSIQCMDVGQRKLKNTIDKSTDRRQNPIQRYVNGDNESIGIPGARLSDNSNILLEDKNNAFATKDKIAQANGKLKDSAGVILGRGSKYSSDKAIMEHLETESKELFNIVPLANKQDGPERQGVLGVTDSLNVQVDPDKEKSVSTDKLKSKEGDYKKFVLEHCAAIFTLISNLKSELLSQSIPDVSAGMGVTNERLVTQTLQEWMMLDAFGAQFIDKSRLDWINVTNPKWTDFYGFLDSLKQTADELKESELDPSKVGKLILPSDCQSAAIYVTGDNISKDKLEPDVGESHFVDFGGKGTGWRNHWAGVVMADGKDTLTLENAAGVEKAPIDRSSWYFGMYGTRIEGQSFQEEYWAKHKARSADLGSPITD
ncbi:MAG: hypothetical protein NE334_03965 [Lentisphaeraceae bacterium]|nr:hypothetical protein [Lentisphaeraceae bacterium]